MTLPASMGDDEAELDALRLKAAQGGVKSRVALARRLEQTGDLRGALEAMRSALQLRPKEPELNANFGMRLYELGHKSEAIAHLQFAVRRFGEAAGKWRHRLERIVSDGLIHQDEGQLRDAFRLLAAGQAQEAAALFEDLTERRPRSSPAWLGLRGALHALGRTREKEQVEARWRAAWPPHRAEVDAAQARPLSPRGLVFDPRAPLPLRPMREVLTPVSSGEALRSTRDSLFEIDPGDRKIVASPVIALESDGSDAISISARTAPRFMARIDNAMLIGQGLVATERGEVPMELLGAGNAKYGAEIRDGRAVFPPGAFEDGAGEIQVFDTPALLMVAPTDASYGDWINQGPPKLAIAEAAGLDLPIVVSRDLAPRFVGMLEALGVRHDRLLRHGNFVSIFPQLYVASPPLSSRLKPMPGWFDIYQRAAAPAPAERRRIYLTRRNIQRRSLQNEPEVAALFASRGFDVVAPETLSLRDMIRLFAGPSIVAGPYGSAMRSLVFCRLKPVVFAIMPPYDARFVEGSALFVAQTGARFAYVRGEPTAGADPSQPNYAAWRVDMGELEQKLDRLLERLADPGEAE